MVQKSLALVLGIIFLIPMTLAISITTSGSPALNDTVIFDYSAEATNLSRFVFSWNVSGSFANMSAERFVDGNTTVSYTEDGTSTNSCSDCDAFDEDFGTRYVPSSSRWVYENWTIPQGVHRANITVKMLNFNPNSDPLGQYYNGSEWIDFIPTWFSDTDDFSIPADGMRDNLQMRYKAGQDCIGEVCGGVPDFKLYETEITWITYTKANGSVSHRLNDTSDIDSVTSILYVNDSSGVWSSSQISFNVDKIIPNVSVSLESKPLSASDDLVGIISFSDAESDTHQLNETRWYKEEVLLSGYTNLTSLASTNTSEGDTWTFSARAFDGFNWSTWDNDSVVIGDETAGSVLNVSSNSNRLSTNSQIVFTASFTDVNSSPDDDACTFQLYKSDLAPDTFNVTSHTKSGTDYSRTLAAAQYGTGFLELQGTWCDDGSGNIDYDSTSISVELFTPLAGAGGSGDLSSCELFLLRPLAGKILTSPPAPTGTQATIEFTIKNTGEFEGTYSFDVEGDTHLISTCSFEQEEVSIGADLSHTQRLTCLGDDQTHTGTVKITGCGQQGSYQLQITDKYFQIRGDRVYLGTVSFHSGIGIAIFAFIVSGILTTSMYLWRKI